MHQQDEAPPYFYNEVSSYLDDVPNQLIGYV